MNLALEVLTRAILRAEKNLYLFRVLVSAAGYVGITMWLNAIRQSASTWFVWTLIGIQLFLLLTIFVVCSLRLRECKMPSWWLLIPLGLSRVNDWEIAAIPAAIIAVLILSERNKHVSQGREHLLQSDEDKDAEIEKMRTEVARLRRDLDLLEDPATICAFGQAAFDGDGVEQDYAEALSWFKIAAEQGNTTAQHNLALMYAIGEGVQQDSAEAAKWYRLAADSGNASSQNNLGILHETGEGVPQDKKIALSLYRQAAEGGDANAESNVGRLESLIELDNEMRYLKILAAFGDLVGNAHRNLVLPHNW